MKNNNERRDSEIHALNQKELNHVQGGFDYYGSGLGLMGFNFSGVDDGQTFNIFCRTCGFKTPHSMTRENKYFCHFCRTENKP